MVLGRAKAVPAYKAMRVEMTRHSDFGSSTESRLKARSPVSRMKARAQLMTVLLPSLFASVTLPAQAQTSGALPIYRCVSADGASSRISRTPCAAGESGSAQHAVAGTAKQQAAIVHQAPSTPAQASQSQAAEETHGRPRAGHRPG